MDDDPGWMPALRNAVGALVPFPPFRQGPSTDGLIALRATIVAVSATLGLFGVVLVFVLPGSSERTGDSLTVWITVAMVAGAASATARLSLVGATPLGRYRCSREIDPAALAAVYRQRCFLGLAFADTSALFGFVGGFPAQSIIPYLVGVAWFTLAFAQLAPTLRSIRADQYRLNRDGIGINLTSALRGPQVP